MVQSFKVEDTNEKIKTIWQRFPFHTKQTLKTRAESNIASFIIPPLSLSLSHWNQTAFWCLNFSWNYNTYGEQNNTFWIEHVFFSLKTRFSRKTSLLAVQFCQPKQERAFSHTSLNECCYWWNILSGP